MGFPELGWVYLPELLTTRGPLGLPVERDLTFASALPISVWADAARAAQHIVVPA